MLLYHAHAVPDRNKISSQEQENDALEKKVAALMASGNENGETPLEEVGNVARFDIVVCNPSCGAESAVQARDLAM